MLNFAALARAARGLVETGTVNSKTLSVAFMEFLGDSDSNLFKALCLSHGFRDVSPLWGERPAVPTFKDSAAMSQRWPEFQRAMVDVEADWFYISGHQGRQYWADDEWAKNGEQLVEHYNDHDCTGFFNEPYHVGPWEHASRSAPREGRSERDVFMFTSRDDWVYELGPEDNPLFSTAHEDTTGVMLVGCHGLTYRHARMQWAKYFPNAIVFGPISRESNSIQRYLAVARTYGRTFLTDPKSIDPEELVRALNPARLKHDRIAVLTEGFLYIPGNGHVICKRADDRLRVDDWN